MKSCTVFIGILSLIGASYSVPSPLPTSDSDNYCNNLSTPKSQFDILQQILAKDYNIHNKDIRPTTNGTSLPTNVTIDYYVGRVTSIDKLNGKFTIQMIFRQRWVDERLAYGDKNILLDCAIHQLPRNILVPKSLLNDIWIPDLYIPEELESVQHGLFQPNIMMKIGIEGNVLLSQRVTVTLACPSLADTDTTTIKECDLNIESYGHKANSLNLEWKSENPIFVLPDINIPNRRFKLDKITPKRCDTVTPNGVYSCLQGKFFFTNNW